MSRSAREQDVVVVGGGLVGLSIALELCARGAQVVVLEQASEAGRTPGQASWAAAGMLAADDPFNPLELWELSRWSRELYPGFLESLSEAAGHVPFQTEWTRQYLSDGRMVELAERSVDPREVLAAVHKTALASGVRLCHGVSAEQPAEEVGDQVVVRSAGGGEFRAAALVWANGAWFRQHGWVRPRKGQMLRVRFPEPMDTVYRAEDIYVVPRRFGLQAGTAVIGATVEDCGFDTVVHPEALRRLQARAAELVPGILGAEVVESWAGLRPCSLTGLPVLSRLPGTGRQFVADGHFRNGILLAPATAVVMADMVEGKRAKVALDAFSAERLQQDELR